jgi:hypothetical protein
MAHGKKNNADVVSADRWKSIKLPNFFKKF